MNVAQLKEMNLAQALHGWRLFPRLNERGSIEGRNSSSVARCRSRLFPRLNERGSIEGSSDKRLRECSYMFPRLNERGSIEGVDSRPSPCRVLQVSTFE